MTPYQTAAPPVPSNVAVQQAGAPADPQAEFIQRMNASAMGPANGQGGTVEYCVQQLSMIGEALAGVAQVVDLEFPQFMPILKIMAASGNQLLQNLVQVSQGMSAPQGPAGQNGSPIPDQGMGQANLQA